MQKFISFFCVIIILFLCVFSGCDSKANLATTVPGVTGDSVSTISPGEDHMHADSDDNGVCDHCNGSLLVNFDIYVVNDLHGKFADTDTQPGVDELSTYLRAAQFGNENPVFLSSGDMWQGSSESNLTKGYIMTDWMNDLGFTAMTLGNHEFDWGEDIIRQNEEIANFPFLAINIYNKDTNQRVEYCDASVMIDRNGVQIGIIGAIGDCYSSIASDWTKDIYFLTGKDLTDLVKAESERLRAAGADFIIYSLHDGYGGKNYASTISDSDLSGYYNTVLSDGYVDIVFEGHTHKYYVKQDSRGVYHLQGGGDNQGIIYVDVDINSVTGSSAVNIAKFVGTEQYNSYSDDPIVDTLMEKYDEQVSIGNEVLGYNSTNLSGHELRRICADLYYEFGEERWGDAYDIVLGGGFFSVRSPGYLASGEITYSQLQMIMPFDNHLVLCSIKGKDLKDKFFESDNTNYFISYGEYGSQVKENLDPDATYYLVVDSYTSTYGPNKLTEIQRCDENIFARDLLAEYIRNGLLE